jgi:UDP-glucose 4-epimerase
MDSIKNKNILITGGYGFYGSHLAQKLAVANAVTLSVKKTKETQKKYKYVEVNLADPDFVKQLVPDGYDYIFHFAGNADQTLSVQNPIYDLTVNTLSTLKFLEYIKNTNKNCRLILASSVTVYGGNKDDLLSEKKSMPDPMSNYGVSKLAAEYYLRSYFYQHGIKSISFRIFSTYGPGLKRQIVFDLLNNLKANKDQLTVIGDGLQYRDMSYIDDQVENILTLVNKADFGGESYNLGSGTSYSTKAIAIEIIKAMNLKTEIVFTGQSRVFDANSWTADNSKILSLGCSYQTKLSDGLAKTVTWFNGLESR